MTQEQINVCGFKTIEIVNYGSGWPEAHTEYRFPDFGGAIYSESCLKNLSMEEFIYEIRRCAYYGGYCGDKEAYGNG